jgi:hypothetical protein
MEGEPMNQNPTDAQSHVQISAQRHVTEQQELAPVVERFFAETNGDLLVLERFKQATSDGPIDWSKCVGEAIQLLRLSLHPSPITQAELARRTACELESTEGSIDQAYISRVEAGKIQPSLRRLSVFAHALGTTVSHIIWQAERAAALRLLQA